MVVPASGTRLGWADLVRGAAMICVVYFHATLFLGAVGIDETLGRALIAVAGLSILAGPEHERELEQAIVDGLAPFRGADGSYRLSNEYRFLVARA